MAGEIALAVVWPSVLVTATVAVGMFDVVLLAALIWATGGDTAGALVAGAAVGGALCVLPGVIALLCYLGAAMDARRPARRALWLCRVAGATRAMSRLIGAALLAGLGLMMLALFAMPSGLDAVAAFAVAMIAVPATTMALRAMQRRMRLLAARARRWARRLCPDCDYDTTGLAQCPECGRRGAAPAC
jgi:hypothetical protein